MLQPSRQDSHTPLCYTPPPPTLEECCVTLFRGGEVWCIKRGQYCWVPFTPGPNLQTHPKFSPWKISGILYCSREIKSDKLHQTNWAKFAISSQIFSLIFADCRFSQELQYFGGADFRRRPQDAADFQGKPRETAELFAGAHCNDLSNLVCPFLVPPYLCVFTSVAWCCGSHAPNMFMSKANAKEDLGEFICSEKKSPDFHL